NVRGVGYELICSSPTLLTLSELPTAQVWVHTHVREDALQLFGFLAKTEKDFFLSLIKINGIGPKVAMKILSSAPLSTIIGMIEDGDVKGLSGLPKVGKKTAEQMILSLKGKLVLSEEQKPRVGFAARADIVSALVNLGFKLQEVEKVVEQMAPTTEFEDGIKRGLTSLAGTF
ncbi:MAG: Holliday junction branch migration protein RuvA, partial [Bdellovibrionales bacterium]|nr:Holliday junction branch migration protein RuvA [Bdellovibrionales bacterium]